MSVRRTNEKFRVFAYRILAFVRDNVNGLQLQETMKTIFILLKDLNFAKMTSVW